MNIDPFTVQETSTSLFRDSMHTCRTRQPTDGGGTLAKCATVYAEVREPPTGTQEGGDQETEA